MKTANSLKELEKQIAADVKKAVVDTLQNEVFELVKDIVLSHVQTDVYDVYNPKIYERRYDHEGLGDENNVAYEIENDETLVVWNIAKYNPYKDGRPLKTTFS